MSALLICYDLHKPVQNYPQLYDAIKGVGRWLHLLDSTWIVVTASSPQTVSDRVGAVLDEDDSWFIVDITRDPRAGWLASNMWDWINLRV